MDHFTYKNGELHAEDVPLRVIAEEIGTPFYCYSRATMTRHYKVFAEALSGLDALICYAVKANGNLAVIRTLASLGAGADVVSAGELERALAAGVPAEKIVFSGVGKTGPEIAQALDAGIMQINVESEPELEAISALASARGMEIPVSVRVNPDVDAKTHAKITTGKRENKFGIEIERAPGVYKRAATLPGIKLVGVAMHIGSQLGELTPYRTAYKRMADLVERLRVDGHAIDRVDLGGGLGIPYFDDAADFVPPSPADYGNIVRETVGHLGCRLLFEPGRVIMGNAGVLVARTVYVKEGETRRFLILDAAMNDLIRPALYSAHHAIEPVSEPVSGAARAPYDVVGPICETGDTFAKERLLPTMTAGDLVAFRSAGAYGATMASTYNARPLIAEVMVDGGRFSEVRRRVPTREMMGFESIPDWLDGAADPARKAAG
ncbi:MAG: diaminopimelate decarboxylase [Rhodospirillales bacterium]